MSVGKGEKSKKDIALYLTKTTSFKDSIEYFTQHDLPYYFKNNQVRLQHSPLQKSIKYLHEILLLIKISRVIIQFWRLRSCTNVRWAWCNSRRRHPWWNTRNWIKLAYQFKRKTLLWINYQRRVIFLLISYKL